MRKESIQKNLYEIMNIIVSSSSRYMRYLYVMLVSLLESNRHISIHIYVLQRDFTDYDKKCISELVISFGKSVDFLFVDENKLSGLPISEKFSMETYFRLVMGEVLPKEVEKALYLDVDIIVRSDLSELYDKDINDYIAVACLDADHPFLDAAKRDLFGRTGDLRYFNAGVMLWNVKELRRKYSTEKFLEAASRLGYSLQFCDQDILNYILYDQILYCDSEKYNCAIRGNMKPDELKEGMPMILHYSGCNPWQIGQKNEVYRVWWDFAKKTPFYITLLEEQLWRESGFGLETEAGQIRDAMIREIYENSFFLKYSGRVRKHLENDIRFIGIYGAGAMADVLYELLQGDCLWGKVKRIVDRTRTGSYHGISIDKEIDDGSEARNLLWIVTPTYRADKVLYFVRDQLDDETEIVSLLDWLKTIE